MIEVGGLALERPSSMLLTGQPPHGDHPPAMSELRRTPLYPAHLAAHAKLVAFAGFEMPVQYTSLIEEHRAVRERAGLFDVSHMGEIQLRGAGAMASLQKLVTNDVAQTRDGQAQYAAVCNDPGTIVDDVVVYRKSATDLLVCVNASNRDKDFAWFREHVRDAGTDLADVGDDYAQLALQGPKAAAILGKLTKVNLKPIGTYHFTQGSVAGRDMLIARTGYTGEDGFELFCAPADAAAPLGRAARRRANSRGSCPAAWARATRCAPR